MHDAQLIGLAAVVVLAIGGQVLAARLRAPSILVLLVLGLVAGPVTGLLDPDALFGEILFPVVALSVSIILFEGGLLLNFDELRGDASTVVRRLLVVGVPVTAVAGALAARTLLGVSPPIAALLGAVLTVSGPTVVLPLLRFIKPAEQVSVVLKWEGIFVDAIGAALTVIAFEAVLATGAAPEPAGAALRVGVTLLAGGVVGTIGAFLLVLVLDSHVVDARLEPAVTVMMVLAAFVAADLVRAESGLFSAIVMGVVLANQHRIEVGRIEEFKETLGTLLTGTLFILLSARLGLDELVAEFPEAVLLTLILVLVVRPVATWLSTVGSRFTWRERAFIGWMAPRGIVAAATASLFAFRLEETDVADVERLAPLTFLVILLTVAVYGLTGQPMARALGVAGEPEDDATSDGAAARDDGGTEREDPAEEELDHLQTDQSTDPDMSAAAEGSADDTGSASGEAAPGTTDDEPSSDEDAATGTSEPQESAEDTPQEDEPGPKKSGRDAAREAAKDVATGLGMDVDRDSDSSR